MRAPVRAPALTAWSVVLALVALVGCNAADPEPASPLNHPAGTPAAVSDELTDWETADPSSLGFRPGVLERLAADAEAMNSTCMVVARDGKLVGEWNWQGRPADAGREVFSVTKSVTSTLVGIAQADGDLSLDDRAASFLPEWRGTESAQVTIRNLLANDSGRFWSTTSDYNKLIGAPNRTRYAVGLGQQHPPGTVWDYNNAAIQTLDGVLVEATDEVTVDFAADRLFEPLGMAHSEMTSDTSGRSTNVFFGLSSTCRDLARFGQLFAQRGRWDGEQLLPAAWVEDAVGAPSQQLNAAYGLLWWLNRAGRQAPGAPEDLYAALGFAGQVVMVDPASRTVVVRLGNLPQAGQPGYGFADAARVVTEALRPAR